MNKLKYAIGVVLLATFAVAAVAEKTDKVNSPVPQLFPKGIYVGDDATNPSSTKSNKVTKSLGQSATIDFASATVGCILSSSLTVTGAKAGDACTVGIPTAAAAQVAQYSCVVDAANSAKVLFCPLLTAAGQITLSGGTGTAGGVTASSICVCTDTTANASVKCAVSGVTLTATGTASDVINYYCRTPVDPASGTFFVRVTSSQ